MTKTNAPRRETVSYRSSERVVAMKWLVVLAALSVATVLDGISVSDMAKPARDAGSRSEQAAITLPSTRCGPGCAIMVAYNQSGDAFSARSQ